MAVVSVQEHWRGRGASWSRDERSYHRALLVLTDDKFDREDTVMAAVDAYVRLGTTHPADAYAFCNRIEPETMNESPFAWVVKCGYTAKKLDEDPLQDPAIITWNTVQYQEAAVRDKDGDAILNSAGDPYDPPVMKDKSRRTCRINKNVASVPGWFLDYEDAVNSDAFTVDDFSVGIGVAKCQKPTISEWKRRNGTDYREVSMELHFSRTGWAQFPLDCGYREKKTVDGGTVLVKIANITSPAPLDGAGHRIINPTPSTAAYRMFETYESLPFSVLPLS